MPVRLSDQSCSAWAVGVAAALTAAALPAMSVDNLLFNRGFEDVNPDTTGSGSVFGDGWGAFGAADFNAFFGANGHASLFPDEVGNSGGVFQAGIAGTAGATYQFDLLNTRIEENFDADLRFGLEYYLADDATKIGETIVTIDAAVRLANGSTDGNVFSMQGTAVPGTAIVRPILLYDNVQSTATTQENVFVFDSFLSEVPAPGGNLLKNPGFEDIDGDGSLGAVWGSFGNAGFNDFFGGNGHASLFADTFGNSGGLFQQSVLGTAGTEYAFSLDDVRIEENFDAELAFGLEFYGDDDFTKLGESLVVADTSVTGDGLSFDMSAVAPAGTVYVRPIVSFDNVNSFYLEQSLANLFIFETSLAEALDALVGDYDGSGQVEQGDLDIVLQNWGTGTFTGDETALVGGGPFDGTVDQNELDGVLQNWGSTASPDFAGVLVPEPTLAGCLALVGATLCRRRW